MKNGIWVLIIVAFTLTAFVGGYMVNGGYFHRSPKLNANVIVIHESLSGKEQIGGGNVITNIAENTIRNFLAFGNATGGTAEIGTNQTKYISLGNCTPAATLTTMTTECVNGTGGSFGRQLGTVSAWMNGTDYSYNVSATWTANVTTTIADTGLHWFGTASSDNNLFAVAAITQTTFNVNDNVTVTWVITCDFN